MRRDVAEKQGTRELSIRLTSDEYARVESLAAQAGLSKSEVVRRGLLRSWRLGVSGGRRADPEDDYADRAEWKARI
jgi:hypothetical protein